MVICEMSDPKTVWNKLVENITVYTAEQLKNFFEDAGFQDVKVERTRKVWICVTGTKA